METISLKQLEEIVTSIPTRPVQLGKNVLNRCVMVTENVIYPNQVIEATKRFLEK